jgi:hypothetical protein
VPAERKKAIAAAGAAGVPGGAAAASEGIGLRPAGPAARGFSTGVGLGGGGGGGGGGNGESAGPGFQQPHPHSSEKADAFYAGLRAGPAAGAAAFVRTPHMRMAARILESYEFKMMGTHVSAAAPWPA